MTKSKRQVAEPAPEPSLPRARARQTLIEAAQRLLVEVGYAQITTRALAEAAGVNQGLIHYYFGSLEEVLFQALEQYSETLLARQRAMYDGRGTFLEKWRTAARFLKEDLAAGYPKVGFELAAMGWNNPRFRARAAVIVQKWREVLTDALEGALREYRLDHEVFPLEGLVSLVLTSQLGHMFESLSGIERGHPELVALFDGWLSHLERASKKTRVRPGKKTRRS
jgi:AcrR family transcriptional regulator